MGALIFDTANAHTFFEAFRFIGDHPGFLAHKAGGQPAHDAPHEEPDKKPHAHPPGAPPNFRVYPEQLTRRAILL